LVEVFRSDADEGYIAVVPDLPGCSAFGNTPEEAVREIGDTTEAWVAAPRRQRSFRGSERILTKMRRATGPPIRELQAIARAPEEGRS
jgi:predicted RNase H-like HicB family nuclease